MDNTPFNPFNPSCLSFVEITTILVLQFVTLNLLKKIMLQKQYTKKFTAICLLKDIASDTLVLQNTVLMELTYLHVKKMELGAVQKLVS